MRNALLSIALMFVGALCAQCASPQKATGAPACELDWHSADRQTIHAVFGTDNFEYSFLAPRGCERGLYPTAPDPRTASYNNFAARLGSVAGSPYFQEFELVVTEHIVPSKRDPDVLPFAMEIVTVLKETSDPIDDGFWSNKGPMKPDPKFPLPGPFL